MSILPDVSGRSRPAAVVVGLAASLFLAGPAAAPAAGLQGSSAPTTLEPAAGPAPSIVRHTRVRLGTGMELDVAQAGPEDGVPVLLLHGFTDSWFSWSRVVERLPAHVRAIIPTQRGHGDSDRPTCCFSLGDFAADAAALLDALGIERAHVVGHSMGGFIAQRFAIEYPERTARLVLVGSATTVRNDAGLEFNDIVQALDDPVDRDFIREFQLGTTALPLPADFIEGIVDESAKLPARVWRDVFGALLAPEADHDHSRIRVPTLVIAGAHDDFFPPADQQRLARAIPGARLLIYPEAAHAPNWEMLDRFVDDVAAFLGAGGPSLDEARDHFLELTDVRLRYRDLGGAGEPVVLLHGYTNDLDTWIEIADSLRADHRVIALDLRGFGQSRPRRSGARYGRAMTADVIELLDSLGVHQAHLVGFSLGGIIAADAARTAPDRVLSLTLLAPPTYADSASLARDFEPFVRDLEERRGLTSFFQWIYPKAAKETMERRARLAEERNDSTTLLEVLRQLGGLVPDSLELRRITAPTLVVVGTADPLQPQGVYATRQLPDARLILLLDGSHGTPVGRPSWVGAFRATAARARSSLARDTR